MALISYLPELAQRLGEHLVLTVLAVTIAAGTALPLTCWLGASPFGRAALLHFCHIAQTIPSLALLAMLLPWLGIGVTPALVVLVLYAALPMVRNALTALADTPRELLEASQILGLTSAQILWHVQVPQGLPFIIAGLRTATVWSVGTATLSAFIGAGGLGDFITRGLALNDTTLLLLGAVPAALLAVSLDAVLGWVERGALRWKNGFSFWAS